MYYPRKLRRFIGNKRHDRQLRGANWPFSHQRSWQHINLGEYYRNPDLYTSIYQNRACPSCGIGNRSNRATCWKCGWEFISSKPYFGRQFSQQLSNPLDFNEADLVLSNARQSSQLAELSKKPLDKARLVGSAFGMSDVVSSYSDKDISRDKSFRFKRELEKNWDDYKSQLPDEFKARWPRRKNPLTAVSSSRRFCSRCKIRPCWEGDKVGKLLFGNKLCLCKVCAKEKRRRPIQKYRRNLIDPTRLIAYRRNPDPEGNPWGPSLYNPLEDDNHPFKDETHYQRIISKLRRNPCGSYHRRRTI